MGLRRFAPVVIRRRLVLMLPVVACGGGATEEPIAHPAVADEPRPRGAGSGRPTPVLERTATLERTDGWTPELYRAFPELAREAPRVSLQSAPTPVVPMDALARSLGLASLHVKRDDLTHATYGGGKVRKLETLFAAAMAAGAERLVTFGSVGSHHALATAVHGRALGFDVELLLLPEPRSKHTKETLARTLGTGASATLVGSMQRAAARATELADGGKTFVIPVGGTSPLANVGFVAAGFELAAQIAAGELEEPERVYLPLGTMGSAAGLAIGLAAAGLERVQTIAVRASSPGTSSQENVSRTVAETVALVRARARSFPEVRARLTIDGAELGRGYALSTTRADRALAIARTAGLELETTYTAKTLAALARDARDGHVRRALFWMTHDPRPPAEDALADASSVSRDLAGWLR